MALPKDDGDSAILGSTLRSQIGINRLRITITLSHNPIIREEPGGGLLEISLHRCCSSLRKYSIRDRIPNIVRVSLDFNGKRTADDKLVIEFSESLN